jgi:hypothetical protein
MDWPKVPSCVWFQYPTNLQQYVKDCESKCKCVDLYPKGSFLNCLLKVLVAGTERCLRARGDFLEIELREHDEPIVLVLDQREDSYVLSDMTNELAVGKHYT